MGFVSLGHLGGGGGLWGVLRAFGLQAIWGLGCWAVGLSGLGLGLGFTLSRLGHARRGQWYEVGVKPEARTP